MLAKASVIRECEIVGSDETFGNVVDLYFDEYGWRTCYFVVEIGSLLSRKRVLVPLSYVESIDWRAKRISVRMTKQSLLDAGSEDLDRDVASQLKKRGAGYVAWPPPMPRPEGSTSQVPLGEADHSGTDDEGKPLLRSAKETTGYAVEATDGPCGHIDDLLIDDTTWNVELLLVNPNNLLPGTLRSVPVSWVEEFDWLSHSVRLNVNKEHVRDRPAYETNSTIDYLLNSVFP